MATAYDTELKRDKDGTWYRWIGTNEKGTRQKFRLGKSKPEAIRRLRLILALYEEQKEAAKFYGGSWCPEQLAAGKAIAKGKKAVLPRLVLHVNEEDWMPETPKSYARTLSRLNKEGEVFQPERSGDFQEALQAIEADQRRNRLLRVRLAGTNPDRDPTGQTVGEAVEAFGEHIRKKCTTPSEGLSAWGRAQINQVESWRRHMEDATETREGKNVSLKLLETDLADLSIAKAQQMVDVVTRRPLTYQSNKKKRMKVKYAQHIADRIRAFFDWLDLADEWEWWELPRFRKVSYKTAPLTAEEKHQQKLAKEKWRLSDDEIQILYSHATPVERVLILLGLNAAFGAGEIGGLRVPYVKFENQQIDGIRFKTGADSRHYLWKETVEALQWELQRREQLPKTDKSKDIFFLGDRGDPLWSTTKSGNYKNGIAKRWEALMNRVRKDHPDFHKYSFNKLRKTAAIRVIEIDDAEAASMILAHGIPTNDDLLKAYVTIPWEKLYKVQEAYGATIRPLLQTETPAFEQPPKNFIGRKRAKRILDEYKSGVPVAKVAEMVGVSAMTVYSHLDRAGLRLRISPSEGRK